jgi:hypothetical protein
MIDAIPAPKMPVHEEVSMQPSLLEEHRDRQGHSLTAQLAQARAAARRAGPLTPDSGAFNSAAASALAAWREP